MNTENHIRTRFAPSPTGYVHIGSLRTTLFTFLFTRKMGGKIILRVEDTDQNRYVPGALEDMLQVFASLGIVFDEGMVIENGKVSEVGEYGPYLQSQRLSIYHKHLAELLEKEHAYYCYCSQDRLEELRKEQIALKQPPMYDKRCRNLSEEGRKNLAKEAEKEGRKPVVRLAVPASQKLSWDDLVFGTIVVDTSVVDDQILLKSDGYPTYHFAVVIDDHLMDITHVTRGEEWIPSTPKQILLYTMFGWEMPQFVHLPNILNADKTKLSKRQGDVAVEDFLAKGYLKEALLNFVALLGWNPKTEQEIFSLEELITRFDFSGVHKAGAVFDLQKLDWLNGVYIRKLETLKLVELLMPYWIKAGVPQQFLENTTYLAAITELEKERLKKLSEIVDRTGYFFAQPEFDPALLVWKKSTSEQTKIILLELASYIEAYQNLETKEQWEEQLKAFILQKEYDNGSVLWPLRVSLTGMQASPGPFEVASTLCMGLGKQEIVARLKKAAQALS